MTIFPNKYIVTKINRSDFEGQKKIKAEVSIPYNKDYSNKIRGLRYSCGCTSADIKDNHILSTIEIMNTHTINHKTVLITATMEDGTSHKIQIKIEIE